MAEVAFAQSFLSTLDARPVKLSPDHVEDPKYYPARPPYILSRTSKPMSKPTSLAPGQERSIGVSLRSLRNPPLHIKLPSQPLNTSMLDIKQQVTSQTSTPLDKIKVLLNKRPLPETKVLKDVVADGDSSVEFALMIVGGAAAATATAVEPEKATSSPLGQPTGFAAIEENAFWVDLEGFLMQRLNDKTAAESVSRIFHASWESNKKSLP